MDIYSKKCGAHVQDPSNGRPTENATGSNGMSAYYLTENCPDWINSAVMGYFNLRYLFPLWKTGSTGVWC